MIESHINAIEQVLIAKSMAAQNAGHPNLRGGPREWFIHEFLENHLPTIFEIGQGEIIDEYSTPNPSKGSYRPQVDLVVYRRDVPKIMYSPHNSAFLSEGVIATIESKSQLTFGDVEKACNACKIHKSLSRTFFVSSPDLVSNIFTYIIAYKAELNINTIAEWLPKLSKKINADAIELIDMIIILGQGVIWRIDAFPEFIIPDRSESDRWAFCEQHESNLYAMFVHMMTWYSTSLPQPDIQGYASRFYFKKVNTI